MEYNYYVAGTSYREENLERMLTRNPDFDETKAYLLDHYGEDDSIYRYNRHYTSDIKFTPEPTNPHDPKAIRIDVDGNFEAIASVYVTLVYGSSRDEETMSDEYVATIGGTVGPEGVEITRAEVDTTPFYE